MKRRIVVTGAGLLTACGKGLQSYWQAALRGDTSIRPIQAFSPNGFPSRYAGEVPGFEPREFIAQKKSIKLMSRDIQMAVAASRMAVEDSRLDMNALDQGRFGVCLGSGIINNELDELAAGIRAGIGPEGRFEMSRFGEEGVRALFPLWFLKYLPNMPACHISIQHGLRGPSNTITTSSAASLQAVGEAARVIERGDADLMLAGGADSEINAVGLSRLHMLGLLSSGSSAHSYAPFDSGHRGIVPAEGAGMVVLEEEDHALSRGARIYAEITGYGTSTDPSIFKNNAAGAESRARAMRAAIADAGLTPADIAVVIADGSGLERHDIEEARALAAVFSENLSGTLVTCLKPVAGHSLYAAGAVELTAALRMVEEDRVPPLMNLRSPRESCRLPFVLREKAVENLGFVLLNCSSFGGQNASVVIGKYRNRKTW